MEAGEILSDGICSREKSDTRVGILCYGLMFAAEDCESCGCSSLSPAWFGLRHHMGLRLSVRAVVGFSRNLPFATHSRVHGDPAVVQDILERS